jgi:hypothetical protein
MPEIRMSPTVWSSLMKRPAARGQDHRARRRAPIGSGPLWRRRPPPRRVTLPYPPTRTS